MNRTEWTVVALLTLLTILSLSFMPPPRREEPVELWAFLGTPTATTTPTNTLSGTPTATTAPTDAATATPTYTAEPADTPALSRSPGTLPVVTSTSTATPAPSPTFTATPFPFDAQPESARYVYIDQAVQHMYVFEHRTLARDIPCSTGLPDSDKYTPAWSGQVGEYWGTFYAFEVYADEAWYLFKSAGSILVHSLPYTLRNGYKVYQDRDALGVRPASHGCIRISPEDAAWFTSWDPEGVPITVSDPHLEQWRGRLSQ